MAKTPELLIDGPFLYEHEGERVWFMRVTNNSKKKLRNGKFDLQLANKDNPEEQLHCSGALNLRPHEEKLLPLVAWREGEPGVRILLPRAYD